MEKIRTFMVMALLGLQVFFCSAQTPAGNRLEVEVDPSTFFLKGYSFHLGYLIQQHHRLNLGTYAFEIPEFLNGNEGFVQRNQAIQLKYDYVFGEAKGWFTGAQFDFTDKKVTHKATDASLSSNKIVVGARVGYRLMLGRQDNEYRGFYLSPWAGLLYNLAPIKATFAEQTYHEYTVLPFFAIHLGWRF